MLFTRRNPYTLPEPSKRIVIVKATKAKAVTTTRRRIKMLLVLIVIGVVFFVFGRDKTGYVCRNATDDIGVGVGVT